MTAATFTITEPGIYRDIPDAAYQRDPVEGGSLSSTGARKLLPPSCPARFAYDREHPPPSKPEFDFGRAAHELVLGAGAGITVVYADDWRTKDARAFRDAAYANGQTPLLERDYLRVVDMADALTANQVAAALLKPGSGDPEVTIVWPDPATGVMCRVRLDWLPHSRGGRLIVPDYKTCESAEPGKLQRAFAAYGYAQQAAFYLAGVRAAGLAESPAFVFVAQEKTPPYLVTVVQLDDEAMDVGARRNRRALEVYAECTRTGVWPAYSSEVELISLPAYALREEY